jgi:uncharacterized lipoprotein YmbA
MMRRTRLWIAFWMALIYLGCYGGGAQYAFYKLPSVNGTSAHSEAQKTGRWVIGLGPLDIPDYLERAAIITRVSDTRLAVNDDHRWAGSLRDDILRVLAAHLEQHHSVKEVVVFPWAPKIEPDFRFKVEIKTFEGAPGEQVTLKAVWFLTTSRPDQATLRRISLVQKKTNGHGMEALVTAMAGALSGLSRDMVGAVDQQTR